ncbi:uncharacterized protein LOC132196320 [Neocloeon triangulifer]|uniref:uncharacterized protein LOC132196320 n=1 Tax=Neocloeon triangulifer TaxID=2078957 RepID=UPI00286FA3EE|nr:uncharacterized protein LOC132196320 [Neocloeon triangulifer]
MAPGRFSTSSRFPKSSTPTSTSSNKSDTSSATFELSIVGLPAPRSRSTTSHNNAALTEKRRALKSAPSTNARASARKFNERCEKKGERPWTSNKRKSLQNAWSFGSDQKPPSDDESHLEKVKSISSKGSERSSVTLNSMCSISASSAGDVSSFEDDSASESIKSEEPPLLKKKECRFDKKFSFPVPARVLEEKLTNFPHEADADEILIDKGKTLARRSEIDELDEKIEYLDIDSESDTTTEKLFTMQGKVLELLENQQSCTRQTWLVLQQLSASLDSMTKRSSTEERKRTNFPSPAPLPETLLLKEAAGCALRLADILSLIGTSVSSQTDQPQKKLAPEIATVPQMPAFFKLTAEDLQAQKRKLQPLILEQEAPQREEIFEQLSASLALRRARISQSDCGSTISDEWK